MQNLIQIILGISLDIKYINFSIGFLIGIIIIRFFIKRYENNSDRNLVFAVLENLPSSGNKQYRIVEEDDKMTLFLDNVKMLDLDLLKRELVYDLKLKYEHNIKVSLNRSDFNRIKSALSFISGVNKEVNNCFQELIDYDYIVVIRDYDFFNKTFSLSATNKYQEPIDLDTLYSCIERLEIMYNVSIKHNNLDGYIVPNTNPDGDFKYKGNVCPQLTSTIRGTLPNRDLTTADLSNTTYKTLKMDFISN